MVDREVAPLVATMPMPSVGEDALAKLPFPKRLGAPSEFGDAAAFLLSNHYVNGEMLRLDGAQRFQPK
jgi:NAD(P)-dependent dehydrogenase (short-subunit alcohol dehydrogenase family)